MNRFIASLLVVVLVSGVSGMTPMDSDGLRRVEGQKGLAIDINNRSELSQLTYTDHDGASSVTGNAGYGKLRFGGGSSNPIVFDDGSGNPVQLNGMTIDADGDKGLVITLPSGQFNLDIPWVSVVDSTTDPGNGSSYGQVNIQKVDVEKTVIRKNALGEGFDIDIDLRIEASQFTYTDPDGSAQDSTGGDLTLRAVDLGDFNDNSPPTLSGLTLNVDGDKGIVVGAPTSTYLEAELGGIELAGSSIGRFRADDMHFDGSRMIISALGSGEGVDGRTDIQYTADYWELDDADGWNGSGNRGNLVRLNSLEIGSDPWGTLGSNTINWEFHADANKGLVLKTDDTDQYLDAQVGEFNVGSGSLGELRVDNLELGYNQFEIQPKNTGIEVDMQLSLAVDNELRLTDEDDGGAISLGRTTNGVALMDESGGNKADLENLTLDVDASNGLVVNAPSGPMDFQVNDVYTGPAGGPWDSMGSILVEWLELDRSRFEIRGNGDGLVVDGALHADIDRIQLTDGNGVDGGDFSNTPASLNLCDYGVDCMTFGDGGGGAVSFSDFQINADGSDGLVVEAPSIPSYNFEMDDLNIDGQQTVLEPVRINNIDPSGSYMKIDAR